MDEVFEYEETAQWDMSAYEQLKDAPLYGCPRAIRRELWAAACEEAVDRLESAIALRTIEMKVSDRKSCHKELAEGHLAAYYAAAMADMGDDAIDDGFETLLSRIPDADVFELCDYVRVVSTMAARILVAETRDKPSDILTKELERQRSVVREALSPERKTREKDERGL